MRKRTALMILLAGLIVITASCATTPIVVKHPTTGHVIDCTQQAGGQTSPEMETATTIAYLGLNKLFFDRELAYSCKRFYEQQGYQCVSGC